MKIDSSKPRPVAATETAKSTPSAPAPAPGSPAAADAFAQRPPAPPMGALDTGLPPITTELAIKESIAIRGPNAELPTPAEAEQLKADGKDVLIATGALREALSLGDKEDEFKTREAVKGVVLSIDSYASLDLDNAMSFQRHDDGSMTVGIHAVDLSEWVRAGGALDFSARRRMESKYLEAQGLVLPMLPLSLSEGKLSLFENEKRLSKSVELHFSKDGALLDTRIFRSQLVNRFRLDDADAAKAAKGEGRGATSPELADALKSMAELAAKANGNPAPGAQMGMEKMLGFFTGVSTKVVGEALADNGYEASFRNQAEANQKSTYGSEAQGHKAIGARAYATWTGPMRRYADLDVHRAMDKLIDGKRSSPRAAEIDTRMRDKQHDRLNKVTADPRMDWVSNIVDVTRKE